jgi:hypothetical protein
MPQQFRSSTHISVKDATPEHQIDVVLTDLGANQWRLNGRILGATARTADYEMVLTPRIFFGKNGKEQAAEFVQKRAARFLKITVEELAPMNVTWS